MGAGGLTRLAEDMRTAAAAHGRKDLRRCDRDHLVDPLLDALETDEVVERFFIDYKIRGGDAFWVALTAHRLLILEYKGGTLHPRHLARPLKVSLDPPGSGLWWRLEVEGADGQTKKLVLLDQAEVEDLLDVETTSKFPRSMRAEPAPHQVPADPPEPATHAAPPHRPRSRSGLLSVRVRRAWRNWTQLNVQPVEDDWSAVTLGYKIPSAVMNSFAQDHPEVTPDALRIVESAFLQWVRIEGRKPGHAQPSVAVDSLWQLFIADETAWTEFTHDVGITMPYRPMQTPAPTHDRSDPVMEALASTFWDAVVDEQPLMLPALFRADEACEIESGNKYQRCCVKWPCEETDRTCFHWSPGRESYG
jgi:hypothetical protein